MSKGSFLHRVFDLYYEGFRDMRLGKTLWAIILIKLFIIFAVLKVFFFPNFLVNSEILNIKYYATEPNSKH